jgi:hypothetical protein
LEDFFCRQVTRWLAEKLGTAEELFKDQTQLNCKGGATKNPQYFAACTLKYLQHQQLPKASERWHPPSGFASQQAKDT